ncbi:MAG TPA: DUF86 domain-containing protein [Oligoflexia bacterium]|nr:DUF86 domain-containing protein [Oligoflexia bacterium]HMP47460.1 DUF86 domain-containing protein [Oligoflexia bacterium]
MTKKDSICNKISSSKKYLSYLEELAKFSTEEISKSFQIRGAVERYIYLLAQSTIDLAEMFISYKDYRKPLTMADCFHVLNENKIINENLTINLSKMVGMRNILAHAYEKVDDSYLIKILNDGKADIEEFISLIESQL